MRNPPSLAGVLAGIWAGLVVAGIEGIALALGGASLHVLCVSTVLLLALGLLVGAVVSAARWGATRMALSPTWRAFLLAAPSVLPTSWVASSLFEGAFAATLPGASVAWLWLPALVWLALAVAILIAGKIERALGGAAAAAIPLVVLVTAEAANRLLFTSGYERVHAYLIVAASSAAMVLGRFLVAPRWSDGLRVSAAAAFTIGATASVVVVGLQQADHRREVATLGNHARHVVRELRNVLDFDGDGYAAWLGGGDCDDSDAAFSPGARDVPGNGVDEDCDGGDAVAVELAPEVRERPMHYADWRKQPRVAAMYERTRAMNAVVISVDALRADSAYSGPTLAALRKRAVVFTRAMSPAAGTDLSLSTFVTGLVDPFVAIDKTIFEAIADRGFVVQAILPSEVLRYAGKTLLTRGIGETHVVVTDKKKRDVGSETTSVETTDKAIATLQELRSQGKPFVLWVHYFDVHEHLQVELGDRQLRSIGGDIGTKEGKYRSLVALVDREVGRLVEAIDRGAEDTMMFVFSDHGESLGDDPRLPDNHGLFVYQPLVAIPALIAIPGLPAREVGEPTTIADLSVTLVELLGAERPDNCAGMDLGVFLGGEVDGALSKRPQPVVLNESEQWGVVEWPYKLMVRPNDNLVELYDLEADPRETTNLASTHEDLVTRLRRLYAGFPRPNLDRTRKARRERERLAQPPRTPQN